MNGNGWWLSQRVWVWVGWLPARLGQSGWLDGGEFDAATKQAKGKPRTLLHYALAAPGLALLVGAWGPLLQQR